VRQRGRWGFVVAAVAYASLLGTLVQSIVVPIIGLVPEYLDTTPAAATWLFTAILLSGAVASVVMGRLADMYGKRRMMLISLAVLVVGSIVGALAQDIITLIVARALQGFAVATLPIAMGILRDFSDGRRLVRGIASVIVMTQIAGGFGSALAGVVAFFLPWQTLFWGSAVLGVIAIVAISLWVEVGPVQPGSRFDGVGTAGLVVGLTAILLGISSGGSWGWASVATLGCIIGGAAVLVLWGWYELRRRQPLIDIRLLASRDVLIANLASLCLGFGMYAILVTMPQLMVFPRETGYGLGETVLMAGLVGAPSIVLAIIVPYVAPSIIARIGPAWTMGVGSLVLAFAYVYLALSHTTNWDFVIANLIVTVGLSLGMGAAPVLILRLVPREQSAEANGVNTVVRTAGMALSTAVTAAILSGMLIEDGFGAGVLPSHDAFLVSFLVAGIGCLAVIPLVAMIGRKAR
jgi:MFS family permease